MAPPNREARPPKRRQEQKAAHQEPTHSGAVRKEDPARAAALPRTPALDGSRENAAFSADRFDARHRTSAPHQNDRHHPQKHHNYGYFGHQGKKPSAANHKFYGSHRPFPYRRPW